MVAMKTESEKSKKPLDMDWDNVFKEKGDGAPAELVVVPKDELMSQQVSNLTDHQLSEKIAGIKKTAASLASKLPDKGAKILISLKLHEEELERRKLSGQFKDLECEKSKQSRSSCSPGTCNGFSSDAAPQHSTQSKFTKSFSETLTEQVDLNSRITVNDKSCKATLGSGRNYQNTKSNGMVNNGRRESKASSRKLPPSQFPRQTRREKELRSPGGTRNSIDSSSFYHSCEDGKTSSQSSKRRKVSPVRASCRLRPKQCETVVLLDEDDCEPTESPDPDEELTEWKEAKIYYPSRNDPECVELQHQDVKCLGPEVYLSSPVMNFYIQYLQQPASAIDDSRSGYHFFNTYFYGKIKESVAGEGKDTDTSFSKFRRWWKGVNIFEKAYILLPIHEHCHWSLVIICLPNKEDESGIIMLHLDSLGFHVSSGIFRNIKRFLIKEWSYLCESSLSLNLPIAEKIWKNLDRRIEGRTIMVPQQKNDYDCGIFVLFFMERFLKDAPKRLRKKDLDMFGKQWFMPEEASRLRGRIRKLLKKEFKNAKSEHESKAPSSGVDSSEHAVEPIEC